MSTVIAFVAALALLIAIHEWGHYRVARACGVRVLRFSIGFGRVLWRRVGRNGTEFTLSALPLGGYVRMLDEREGFVSPEEREQAFNNRPLSQRAAIVAAGPAANWVLAVVLFALVAWMGSEQPKALLGTPPAGSLAELAGVRSGDLVRAISADGEQWRDVASLSEVQSAVLQAQAMGQSLHLSVTDAQGRGEHSVNLALDRLAGEAVNAQLIRRIGLGPWAEPLVREVTAGGAADVAGLRPEDRVLSIDGREVTDASVLRELIRGAHDGRQPRTQQWQVERGGHVLSLPVTPGIVDEGGQPVARLGVGIGSPPERVLVRYGFLDGFVHGAEQSWDMATMTLRIMGRMIVGEASVKNLSGPLSIADYAGQSARAGLVPFLEFLARISMSLAVLNLLPLPMLDGGHLMYHLFEGLTGRPVSERWQRQLQRAGALVLMLMMALALSNDVARLAGWQ